MAKNKAIGDNQRKSAAKGRSQIKNPLTGTWTKRDGRTGRFMDVEDDTKPFKGAKRDTSSRSMQRTADRYSDVMKRLAKR